LSEHCLNRESEPIVNLGKLGKPHGISGNVRLFLYNPASDFIYSLKEIFLLQDKNKLLFKVKSANKGPGRRFVILKLDGINTREKSEQLVGSEVVVPRSWLPPLDKGEFYIADLLGMEAWDEDLYLGKVVESREQGGIEMLTIADNQWEIQIPFVEQYIKKSDFIQRKLLFHNTEGLPKNKIG
jgi:16S rRNA processing protein RimM